MVCKNRLAWYYAQRFGASVLNQSNPEHHDSEFLSVNLQGRIYLVTEVAGIPARRVDGSLIVAIPESLTVVEAVPLRTALRSVCEGTDQPLRIILDFSGTKTLDSSGIGALVSVLKLTRAADIELSVRGLQPQIRALLTLTRLDTVLNIESDVAEASRVSGQAIELPVTHPSIRSRSKRAIDVLGAVVGLSITAVVFVPIAIAIKLDSPGPVLFSQTRCGWLGTTFRLWKFRSMSTDAEARKHEIQNEAEGAIFKAKNDPRITRVGRFLRKTSLDELPQFWNVLLGSMSLVGTRPPTPDEVDLYDVPEWRRLNVKPGITGEWQVHGRSSIKDFSDIIRLDLRYQHNWSLWYDFRLLLKTVRVVFSRDSGAM